jgi:hypothetical protein
MRLKRLVAIRRTVHRGCETKPSNTWQCLSFRTRETSSKEPKEFSKSTRNSRATALNTSEGPIRKGVAVERVFSRLKNLTDLTQHKLRGLAKITFHTRLCLLIMLFTAQAALNTSRPDKSRSIRYFKLI